MANEFVVKNGLITPTVELPGTTSGSITISAPAVAGTTSIALPATAGTIVTTGDTGTVTNTMLAGSIANNKLANSTISGTALGGTLPTATFSVSGTGLSGSATYNGTTSSTFTVTSNATSANTVSTIVARDASGDFSAGTITAALNGNASTASTLQTARTITLSGDVAGSVSFNGSTNVTITTTIQPDSVALGTDTTGNYMVNVAAGTGVSVSHTQGEGSTATVSIGQAVGTTDNVTFNNVTVNGTLNSDDITSTNISVSGNATITGNLTVSGTTTTVNSTAISIADINIELARNATTAAQANGAGLTVIGPTTSATLTYTSADDRWNFNKNLNVSTVYGALSGNATTATTLQTARTINGVSFDGSANISFSTSSVSEGTNLYYTDTRARAALSFAAGSGAYNSSTGVITIPTNTNQLTNGAGFITGYTETDTLATVTARGASTGTAVTLSSNGNHYSGHLYYDAYDAAGNYYPHFLSGSDGTGGKINWRIGTGSGTYSSHYWDKDQSTFFNNLRAPIFYDSNDTTYYVNPNDTSTSAVFAGNLSINGVLVRRSAGTGYLSGNYSSSENTTTTGAIYTIGGSYYPTSTALNNIYGIGYTYAGVAGGTASATGSSAWGLYIASGGNTRVFLDSDNGRVIASESARIPIYYDRDDTTYYVDPANISRMVRIAFGTNSNQVNINYDQVWRPDAGILYLQSSAGGNLSLVEGGGSVYVGGTIGGKFSIRAGGAAGVGWGTGFNIGDASNYLGFIQDGGVSRWRNFGTGGYDWWSSSAGTQLMVLNNSGDLTTSSSMRSPIFYDSNDTAYYVDPANTGTSARFAGQIVVEDGIRTRTSGYGSPYNLFALSDTYDSGTYYGIKYVEGDPDVIQVIGGNNVGLSIGMDTGNTTASHSLRAPIFYDSNDTSFYLDPNSTSTSLQVAGTIEQGNNYAHPNIDWGSSGSSTGMVIFYLPGTTSNYGMVHMVFDIYEYASPRVCTVVVGGHNWSTAWYNNGCNVVGFTDKQVRLGVKDGRFVVVFGASDSGWSYGQIRLRKIQNGSYYNNAMDLGGNWSVTQTTTESFSWVSGDLRNFRTPSALEVDGIIYGYSQLRTPIYYDYNDTNYYVDPNSTSRIRKTNLIASGSGWDDGLNLYSSDATNRWNLLVDDGSSDALRIAYNNSEAFNINTSRNVTVSVDIRAPIFYDSGNTSYYVDPADGGFNLRGGTSNRVIYSTTDSGFKVYNAEGNGVADVRLGAAWGYPGVYSSTYLMLGSENYIEFRTQNVQRGYIDNGANLYVFGSTRSPIFYDYDNTGYYVDPNSVSIFNDIRASSGNTQIVTGNTGQNTKWRTLSSGATDVGISFYDVNDAWRMQLYASSGNYGFLNGNWASWDMRKVPSAELYLNNQSTYYINGSEIFYNRVYGATDMRSPIFYDYNDTAYYCDPNGSSRFNEVYPNNVYNYGWFRNQNSGQGLYNTANDAHFYSAGANLWHINGDAEGITYGGLVFYDRYNSSQGNSTGRKGYVYWDSTGFGLLDSTANWSVNIHSTNFKRITLGGSSSNNAYGSLDGIRLMFGGGDSDAAENYYIGTNFENYGGNYTKLDLRWHTGIRIGAQPNYGGVRIYDTEDLGTIRFSVNKGDAHTRVESGDFYAANLIDRDDTNYYLNPNGTSRLVAIDTTGSTYNIFRTWTDLPGHHGFYSSVHNGAHFYPHNGSYGAWRIDGSRNSWRGLNFDNAVTLMMNNNETGLYRDGYGWQFRWYNGSGYISKNAQGGGTEATIWDTSNLTNLNQLTNGPGYITGYTETDTLASVTGRGFITRASSGSFAVADQATPGLEIYGAGSTEPAFMTFHRPGVYAVKFGLDGSDLKVGGWSMGAVAYTVWHSGNLTNLNQLTNGPGYIVGLTFDGLTAKTAGTGTYTTTGDFRAPIFYNHTDTGYYVDPDSLSVMNRISLGYNSGENNSIGCSNWFRSSGSTGWYNGSYAGGIYMQDSTWVRVYNNKQFYSENYIQSDSSVRAPIFYDSNNTSFYVDPSSTTTSAMLRGKIEFFDYDGAITTGARMYYGDRGTQSTASTNATVINYGVDGFGLCLESGSSGDSGLIKITDDGILIAGAADENLLIVWDEDAQSTRLTIDDSGNLVCSGNVTAYSDIKLKTNIEQITNAIDKVKQIRGVTFERIDEKDKYKGHRYAGVIAQEVEAVFPEVIDENSDGIKNVAYGNMVGLLIEAIKEQQSEIDELKALVKQLLAK